MTWTCVCGYSVTNDNTSVVEKAMDAHVRTCIMLQA